MVQLKHTLRQEAFAFGCRAWLINSFAFATFSEQLLFVTFRFILNWVNYILHVPCHPNLQIAI